MENVKIKHIDVFNKEYEYIKSDRYRKCAKELVELLPDYFFEVSASSTGKYHPSFSLGDGGLVRHTKVAVKIAHELLENNSLGHKFTSDEKDLIIISLMMHDGLKHGIEESKYTVFEHPLIVGNYIKENKDKLTLNDDEIEFITRVISSHMGEWNTNNYSDVVLPLPKDKYQRFVHMCDFLASRKFLDVKFENNDILE
ncbi:MAG: HD domain-containing protein [Bacilli bacterium]|nr:HD domain-containing protein [Bacilli bacterium]